MKTLIYALLALISVFVFTTSVVFGEDATSSATQRYHINFPIAQLGNCASVSECKTYCDNPQNSAVCQSYAQSKGFANSTNSSIAVAAKQVLGCDYQSGECKQFCSQSVNFDKCQSFGQKYFNIQPKGPDINSLLKKAQQLLGCNSVEACKQFCAQSTNADKCRQLLSSVSTTTAGDLTKNISLVCSNYCSSNPGACTSSGGQTASASGSIAQVYTACRAAGCLWSNSTYTCSCQRSASLETIPASPTGVLQPQVKGISIGPNFFQSLLAHFLGR